MRTIAITSGKGGVGKTTVTANIGVALSATGARVLLLDGDAGLRNLDISLGLSNKIVFDAKDIANGNANIEDAIIKRLESPNMDFIAAPRTRDSNAYIPTIKKIASQEYDYLLIDSPAGIDAGFAECASVCDYSLVVVTPDVSSVRDAMTTIEILRDEYDTHAYVLLNRTRAKLARKGQCMSASDVVDILGCSIIGQIPESNEIVRSGNLGLIADKGKIYKAFLYAAKAIIACITGIEESNGTDTKEKKSNN